MIYVCTDGCSVCFCLRMTAPLNQAVSFQFLLLSRNQLLFFFLLSLSSSLLLLLLCVKLVRNDVYQYELKDAQAVAADDKFWGDPVAERFNNTHNMICDFFYLYTMTKSKNMKFSIFSSLKSLEFYMRTKPFSRSRLEYIDNHNDDMTYIYLLWLDFVLYPRKCLTTNCISIIYTIHSNPNPFFIYSKILHL